MADKRGSARPASPLKSAYLILYNFASAVAWSVVLGRTIGLLRLRGPATVYAGVGEWTKRTQTMAIMEIAHSLLGRPPSPRLFFPSPPLPARRLLSRPLCPETRETQLHGQTKSVSVM